MNKFCTTVSCAFAAVSLSCATPQSPTVSSIPENNGPKASAPSEATGNIQQKPSTEPSIKTASHRDNVLTNFYKLYPEGSGKPFDQLVLEDQDIKNGYLRVTGAIEGHYVFALFKSPNADWLIEQRTGCGPECDQTFKVYRFVNGKREETKTLESLYPPTITWRNLWRSCRKGILAKHFKHDSVYQNLEPQLTFLLSNRIRDTPWEKSASTRLVV